MSEPEPQHAGDPSSMPPPEGIAAATAAGAAAGPVGGIAALRGAYARARSFVERPRWRGLVALGVIAVALVAAFFLIPWRAPEGTTSGREQTADRLAALEESSASLKADVDGAFRRLSALERAYEELAAEGTAASDLMSLADRVAGLVTTMEQLSARVDALETRGLAPSAEGNAQASAPSADLRARIAEVESDLNALSAALKGRLDSLEGRVGNDFANRILAVEQAQSAGPSKDDIEGLAARLTLLETSEGAAAMRRATRALAVSALSQAVWSDAPFPVEARLVSDLLGEDPAVATLFQLADQGVPSAARLDREFEDAARRALAAEEKPETGEQGFLARLWRSIRGLVTVRRMDGARGTDLEAALARVESALARQDVRAAVREAQAISGAPRNALTPWLDRAQEHIEADQALRALRASSLRDLSEP